MDIAEHLIDNTEILANKDGPHLTTQEYDVATPTTISAAVPTERQSKGRTRPNRTNVLRYRLFPRLATEFVQPGPAAWQLLTDVVPIHHSTLSTTFTTQSYAAGSQPDQLTPIVDQLTNGPAFFSCLSLSLSCFHTRPIYLNIHHSSASAMDQPH